MYACTSPSQVVRPDLIADWIDSIVASSTRNSAGAGGGSGVVAATGGGDSLVQPASVATSAAAAIVPSCRARGALLPVDLVNVWLEFFFTPILRFARDH